MTSDLQVYVSQVKYFKMISHSTAGPNWVEKVLFIEQGSLPESIKALVMLLFILTTLERLSIDSGA